MLAMRLLKSIIVMAPQQQQQRRRRHPVGVLHAALLLLCLALLMLASVPSANARPVPSETDSGYFPKTSRQPPEEGTASQQVSPLERSILPNSDTDEDNLKDCAVLPDSTYEPCVSTDGRILVADYGSPGGNPDSRPGGPIPYP